MAQISVNNLTFGYDGSPDLIFEDVSFVLDTDWRLGFTGRNGRGKTTFLRLLTGGLEYRGSISSPVSFSYYPFTVEDENLSAGEMIAEICPEAQEWEILRELNLLEAEDIFYRPYNTLSGGEKAKAQLCALFLGANNFLLIDEPTNHLDERGRKVVSAYLNKKKGFIVVSHDRAFLDNCVTHILSINKTDIEVRRGNFSEYLRNKELRDSFELTENEKLKGEIKRLKDAAKRKENWADSAESAKYGGTGTEFKDRGFIGAKAAKVMKSAKGLEKRQEKAAEEKSSLLKNIETQAPLTMKAERHTAETLIEARGLSLKIGGREIYKNVKLTVGRGGRLRVTGGNGSGKSCLLKILAGVFPEIPGAEAGGVTVRAPGLKISYVSQDTTSLRGGLTDYAADNGIDETLFKTLLIKMDFSRGQFDKDISEMSEGQKKKVLLAASLCRPAHLYIWDEPLNFIDIYSRMQIEDAILNTNAALIFVEHDADFAEKIAQDTLDLDSI